MQISLAHAVVKAHKSSHITPILKSLHWLKVNERIEYKLLSLTYEVLTTTQPNYLNNLISVQPFRSTLSHVTPLLRDKLHWLRARERITFKLCLLVKDL